MLIIDVAKIWPVASVGYVVSRKPELYSSSVVCIGKFNSSIVTPDWLARHKLIGSEDADVARSGAALIISSQATQFETAWFTLQVIDSQLTLNAKGALTGAFKDLAVGILSLLPETPVSAIGVNFMGHYKLENLGDLHTIGDVLAPKTVWNELFPDEATPAGLANLTITVRKMDRKEVTVKDKDFRNIIVQPSNLVPHGIFFIYNDHHDLPQGEDLPQTPIAKAAEIIDSTWDGTNAEALRLFEGIISKALGEKTADKKQ